MPMKTALEYDMCPISSRFPIVCNHPHPISSTSLPCMAQQVYYLPVRPFYNQVTVPTMITSLPLIRDILIREEITILHGHGVGGASHTACYLWLMVGSAC